MWFLTLSTAMEWFAFTNKVTRLQAIQTVVVVPQHWQHLLMWEGLEGHTGVERMFVCTTRNTGRRGIHRVGRKGSNRLGGWWCLLSGFPFLEGTLWLETDVSEAWAWRFRNSNSLEKWGMSADSWLCRCHSNIVYICVELEFQQGSNESTRRLIAHGLKGTKVLLGRVMQTA